MNQKLKVGDLIKVNWLFCMSNCYSIYILTKIIEDEKYYGFLVKESPHSMRENRIHYISDSKKELYTNTVEILSGKKI